MKSLLTLTILTTLVAAGTGQAQQTTQAGVLGPSDDATYSLRVQGANGVIYNCKDAIANVDGVATRECIREAGAGGAAVFGAGAAGLTGGGAVAAGIVGLVVVAAAAGGGGGASTTTTGQ